MLVYSWWFKTSPTTGSNSYSAQRWVMAHTVCTRNRTLSIIDSRNSLCQGLRHWMLFSIYLGYIIHILYVRVHLSKELFVTDPFVSGLHLCKGSVRVMYPIVSGISPYQGSIPVTDTCMIGIDPCQRSNRVRDSCVRRILLVRNLSV